MVTTGSSFPHCHSEWSRLLLRRAGTSPLSHIIGNTLIQMIIWIHPSQAHSAVCASMTHIHSLIFYIIPRGAFYSVYYLVVWDEDILRPWKTTFSSTLLSYMTQNSLPTLCYLTWGIYTSVLLLFSLVWSEWCHTYILTQNLHQNNNKLFSFFLHILPLHCQTTPTQS